LQKSCGGIAGGEALGGIDIEFFAEFVTIEDMEVE